MLKNPSLAKVLKEVREHPSFEPPIKFVTVSHKTRYLIEYSVYAENKLYKGDFYLTENLRTGRIYLIDFKILKKSVT